MGTKIDQVWVKTLRKKFPQAEKEAINPLVLEVERLEAMVNRVEEYIAKNAYKVPEFREIQEVLNGQRT